MKKVTTLILFLFVVHFIGYSQDNVFENTETLKNIESYIYSDTIPRKQFKKAFKKVKKIAKEDNAQALCLLGVLYKDGIGTHLNFNKARKQFKKAYTLGNEKAAYSMGYMYLKGLGTIKQDYKKAINWFRKSTYPMAKHWLAKCHYYGLGVPANKEKGMQLLKENTIINSEVLLSQWQYEKDNPQIEIKLDTIRSSKNVEETKVSINTTTTDNYKDTSGEILGQWYGDWEIMDFSGKKVMRSIPISIEILDSGTGILNAKVLLDGNEFIGNVIQNKEELIFPEMSVMLRKRYTDWPEELTLDYRLTSFKYKTSNVNGLAYMSGKLETTIENWKEPGPPSKLILQRSEQELSQKIRKALAEQKEHFIKVYPNPFEQDLLVHYTLEEDADVTIQLADYYHPSRILKTKNRTQKKGERMVTLEELNTLNKGLYVIKMSVGKNRYSRIVIRK
ncbi:tetratricopeptide repeat protein [uncultured Maribacter sp.]|uniref:tetratricopeptide repeat protein n=1 Tax=uncultured Maribacter sp. TaxID=431308 RepID=UPI002616EFA7|nr:tetratricopeptide repeat protein [uncultured Maribacter sp.]